MKVWITKYALTKGIIAADAEVCSDISADMIRVAATSGNPWHAALYHKEGRDWHRSEDAAKSRAAAMRAEKIKSLEKQKRRLELMRF